MECFMVTIIIALFLGCSLQQRQSIDDLLEAIFNYGQSDTTLHTTSKPTAECVCVPYYLCDKDTIINTDSVKLTHISIDDRKDEGGCLGDLDVCCLLPNVTEVPIKPEPDEHTRPGCGYRNKDGVGFRYAANVDGEAEYGEFPWMVAVLQERKIDGSDKLFIYLQCGGALIHPEAVVKAAHCVSDRTKSFKIRAGEWDLTTKQEIYPQQERSVKSVEIYPDYYAGALLNDIAVLILDKPFELTVNVNVICLPPQGEVIPEGTRCFASGWGRAVFGEEGKYHAILKRVELPVVQREKCQRSLKTTKLGAIFQLHKSFICAGGEPGKDTCKGDGGSPLVCPISGHDGRYQQVGIVAWGIGCGENNVPGVYANVALFRNWIDEKIKKHNLDTKSYNY